MEVYQALNRKKIGIVICKMENVNIAALKYFLLMMNRIQDVFEYQLLPYDRKSKLLNLLSEAMSCNREDARSLLDDFEIKYIEYIEKHNKELKLTDDFPEHYVIISLTRFYDEYYSLRKNNISVIGLGYWEREMSPPTVLEFIFTLIMRESIAAICPTLKKSVHLGTKGCLCDFTNDLGEVRYKVLIGYICNHCKKELINSGHENLISGFEKILTKEWMGKRDDPSTPAGIIKNLGFDLFCTKGFQKTAYEKFMDKLPEEAAKTIVTILITALLTTIMTYLGIKYVK